MRFNIQEVRINVTLKIVPVATRMLEEVMEDEDEVVSTTKVDMITLSIIVLPTTKMGTIWVIIMLLITVVTASTIIKIPKMVSTMVNVSLAFKITLPQVMVEQKMWQVSPESDNWQNGLTKSVNKSENSLSIGLRN